MRVIIAGSRDFYVPIWRVAQAVAKSHFEITELVSGCATGIDKCGERWAETVGVPIHREPYVKGKGRAGGPERNGKMAAYADALIVIKRPGHYTPGTYDMARKAWAKPMPVYVHEVDG